MREGYLLNNLAKDQDDVIAAIKQNDQQVLQQLYQTNFEKVELLVLQNNGTKENAKDIYQEAFIAVWKNIKHNKFVPQSESSINSYLYTIAKNKWMDYLRSSKYKKTKNVNEDWQFNTIDTNPAENFDDKFENERLLGKTMKAFDALGLPCKSLLTKFYFEKKSIKDIAKELKIDSASARNKKYRCMLKLRALAFNLKHDE